MKKHKFDTDCIHISKEFGQKGSLNVPIYQNSTFAQEVPGEWMEYTYTRTNNPTEEALRQAIAKLEGGSYGVVFSSGLGAINALMEFFTAGDHIISSADVYGGTHRLLSQFVQKRGLEITFVPSKDANAVSSAIKSNTKLIYIETPSNPLLEITDLKAISEIAKKAGCLLAVDNTMATPYFQRPLEHGADIVVHSLSKYISGHTNVIGGAIVAKDPKFMERIKFIHKATGANPGPFDCYLSLLGLKTLGLRMREHQKNALIIAEYLEKHPKVKKVYYPGLASHPQYELAKKQMSGFGGIVSFEYDGDPKKMIESVELFTISISFGSVASLISHPPKMSHKDIPAEERGFSDSFIRLSVGIENIDDILEALSVSL